MINPSAIFSSTNVKSSLVTNKCNFTTTTSAYDLTAAIYSKIFNFNNFVSELVLISFLLILQYYHLMVKNK